MSKSDRDISMAVIRRLPKYHRYLKDLIDKEIYRISSKALDSRHLKSGRTSTTLEVLDSRDMATMLRSFMKRLEKYLGLTMNTAL